MNKNFKYLIWSGTISLIVLSLFLLVAMEHISDTTTSINTISFSGEGKVVAIPDIATLGFSIVTEATTSRSAQADNSEKSKKVYDFLKNQGIEDKDIKTTGYNIYPQYSYPRPLLGQSSEGQAPLLGVGIQSYPAPEYYPSNPKITSYQVTQSFEVRVRDLEKISAVLDGLVSAGANQVYNLGFRVDNEEKLKDEAREKAIKNAKDKARQLEKQLGIDLDKIVNYSEGGNYPIYLRATEAIGDGKGGGEGPSIPAGENEIVVNVTITYQIK